MALQSPDCAVDLECTPLVLSDIESTGPDFITTKARNHIATDTVLDSSANIRVAGHTILSAKVRIRGDLAPVKIGEYTYIGAHTLIEPCEHVIEGISTYVPAKIGDYCLIGERCILGAATIGSHVRVADDVIIGKRVLIASCSVIQAKSYLPPGTVVPPFSVMAGSPARRVASLAPAFDLSQRQLCLANFARFEAVQRMKKAAAIAALTSPSPSPSRSISSSSSSSPAPSQEDTSGT